MVIRNQEFSQWIERIKPQRNLVNVSPIIASSPNLFSSKPLLRRILKIQNQYRFKGTVRSDWICMRVVSLESPLKGHQPLYVLNFLFLILNIWKDFKVLSRFMQKWIQPPACSDHGLHRIFSSYWLAHFYLMKKSAKELLYFGLECGMMKFFTFKPQPKEQLISLPHFWSTVQWKRSRFEHMQTVIRTSRRIRGLFAWSGSELGSFFKYSALKLKNQKPIAVDVLFKAYPMVPPSCRSNLAGRYL